MDHEQKSDAALERFFDAGRTGPDPSDALLARVLGDAGAVADERAQQARTSPHAPPRPSGWRKMLAQFGGAGGSAATAGALTACLVLGIWAGAGGFATDPMASIAALVGADATAADLDPLEIQDYFPEI